MGKTQGSPPARKQLGSLLRQLREQAKKTVPDVVESGIMGDTKLWRIETGKILPSLNDILALCWVYQADQPTTRRFTDMVTEIAKGQGGFWEAYGEKVPPWLSLNVGYEQTAQRIAVFQPELVHGLLQSPAYALAANSRGVDMKDNADLRMARQQAVLDRKDDYRVEAVLGAGALARQVGGADVMVEQIDRLRELDDDPRFDIRVLGWDVGMHDSINGPYTLFEFVSEAEEPVVYVPLLAGGRYLEGTPHIDPYQSAFSSIWTQATPFEEYTL